MRDGKDSRLEASERARTLLDQWGESLAQVLESMTDQRPEVQWRTVAGPLAEVSSAPEGDPEMLWWEQPFQVSAEMVAWVAAPRATWEFIGTLTLKAAGLETVETSEARNTWFEILGQSLSALARSIGAILGREVNCETGLERAPEPEVALDHLKHIARNAEQTLAPLLVTLSPSLIAAVSAPPAAGRPETHDSQPQRSEPVPSDTVSFRSRTMDLLLDVDLPVSISFGKAQLPMKDVLKLTTGSIVELNRGVNEQVEVLVNQCLIARGEVVVVDGNYGVRIQEIASRQDRLRFLR